MFPAMAELHLNSGGVERLCPQARMKNNNWNASFHVSAGKHGGKARILEAYDGFTQMAVHS